MNQNPYISPYEGKQGRHPKDCTCSSHRGAPPLINNQFYSPQNVQGYAMTTQPSPFVPQNNPMPQAPVAPTVSQAPAPVQAQQPTAPQMPVQAPVAQNVQVAPPAVAPAVLSNFDGLPGQSGIPYTFKTWSSNGKGQYFNFSRMDETGGIIDGLPIRRSVNGGDAVLNDTITIHKNYFGGNPPAKGAVAFYLTIVH